MSTYSQDGVTPDPSTPVYEDISMDANRQGSGTSTGSGGKKDTAKQEASGVANETAEAGQQVVGEAKHQAKKVTSEAASQARGLLDQAGNELKQQASAQQDRVAQGIRSIGQELNSLASGEQTDGPASQVVRTVAQRADAAAGWLEGRDPGSLLGEVRSFAARRPGTFIAIAALAGVVAGRLTTSLVTEAKESRGAESASGGQYGQTTSALPATNVDSPLAPSPEAQGETAFPPVSAPPTGTGVTGGYATGAGYEPGTGFEGTEGGRR